MSASSTEVEKEVDYKANVEYWSGRWAEDKIGWHKNQVNPILIKHLERLTNGDKTKRFFVPLCGKSLDVIYLLNEGYTVFAVEAVKKAIEALDTENSLKLNFNEEESLMETPDGRLKIYNGDIFECPIEKYGPFDCVWDRGSFIAFEFQFRNEYIKVLKRSLLSPDAEDGKKYHNFRYLLETVDYDKKKYGGPPRSVDMDDINKYYSEWTNIELLSRDPDLDGGVSKVPGIGPVFSVIYFLTPK